MPETALPPDLPGSLDAAHIAVREAFQRRDLDAYLAYLAADLSYREADGRIQTRESIGRSVKAQLERLVAFSSSFERESLQAEGQEVVETGTQTASISLRWLFIFARRWTVRRRGRYTWRRRRPSGWELCRVELYEERITRDGVGIAAV
jgi:hypothetical protein